MSVASPIHPHPNCAKGSSLSLYDSPISNIPALIDSGTPPLPAASLYCWLHAGGPQITQIYGFCIRKQEKARRLTVSVLKKSLPERPISLIADYSSYDYFDSIRKAAAYRHKEQHRVDANRLCFDANRFDYHPISNSCLGEAIRHNHVYFTSLLLEAKADIHANIPLIEGSTDKISRRKEKILSILEAVQDGCFGGTATRDIVLEYARKAEVAENTAIITLLLKSHFPSPLINIIAEYMDKTTNQ